MNLIIFLIRAFAGLYFLVMAGMSIDPDLPKYNNDWHRNPGATVASLLLATLYFWPLIAEVKSGSIIARMPTARSFTGRRFLSLGRWFLAYMGGILSVDYIFELQFSCGILSLIAVACLMPPLDRLLFKPYSEMAVRLDSNSTYLKLFPNLGAFSIFVAFGFFVQKDYTGTIYTLLISIGLLLVVPIVLLSRGGWKALSLKSAFSPAVVSYQQVEISIRPPNVTKISHPLNCALCSGKLHFLNTPLFGFGRLKDGGILCSRCCNKKIDTDTFYKLKKYTLGDLKDLTHEKAIAGEQKKADKLLQKKLEADKREADRLLKEKEKAIAEEQKKTDKLLQEKLLKERAIAEEQKKKNTAIQQIIFGLLQQAIANEQKSARPKRNPPAPKAGNSVQMKDVFLCHASEDKRSFIEPLIKELLSRDISCWYDNSEIKWGDSIVKKVNQGLSSSRFVLVAISMNSIKKHWPNAYPILLSKLYVTYSIGIKEISRLLKERIIVTD